MEKQMRLDMLDSAESVRWIPERLCHYWLSRVRMPAVRRQALKGNAQGIKAEYR